MEPIQVKHGILPLHACGKTFSMRLRSDGSGVFAVVITVLGVLFLGGGLATVTSHGTIPDRVQAVAVVLVILEFGAGAALAASGVWLMWRGAMNSRLRIQGITVGLETVTLHRHHGDEQLSLADAVGKSHIPMQSVLDIRLKVQQTPPLNVTRSAAVTVLEALIASDEPWALDPDFHHAAFEGARDGSPGPRACVVVEEQGELVTAVSILADDNVEQVLGDLGWLKAHQGVYGAPTRFNAAERCFDVVMDPRLVCRLPGHPPST